MNKDNVVPFKPKSFMETAKIMEESVLTCECGSQSFTLYISGDVQCTECEEFVQVGCYIEE